MTVDDAAKLQTEIRGGLSNPPHRDSALSIARVRRRELLRLIEHLDAEPPASSQLPVASCQQEQEQDRSAHHGHPPHGPTGPP